MTDPAEPAAPSTSRPADRLLAIALTAVIAFALAITLFVMRNTDLRGDEYSYVAGATALGGAIAGRTTFADAMDTVVWTGWFMPGTAFAGAPLFALEPFPSHLTVRLWSAALNGALFAAAAWAFRKVLGPRALLVLLVFPGLAAAWQLTTVLFLPDLPAGLLATMALLLLCRVSERLTQGRSLRWAEVAGIELLLAAALYLRGPMIAVAITANLLLGAVVFATRGWKAAGKVAVGAAGLALLLAPWSVMMSSRFGETVLTTTNVPLVLADSFGSPDRNCFGPCPPGEDIGPAWKVSESIAAHTGDRALDIQRAMMRHALKDLTPRGYLAKVRAHFATFLFDPGGQAEWYEKVMYGVPEGLRGSLTGAVRWLTLAIYLPFLAALLLANLWRFRRSDSDAVQALAIKAMTGCLFLQPFVHKTSARYWTTFAPLMAWSAVLLLRQLQTGWSSPRAGPERRSLPAVFDWAQLAWTALFLGAAAAILAA